MRRGIDTTDSSSFGHRRARAMRPVTTYRLLIALAMIGALTGCGGSTNGDESSKVNGSIHVAAGKPATAADTVNGSIHIDDNATVTSAATVNGSLTLGAHTTATSLNTVNGSITLGAGAQVSGGATSVNGDLTLGEGADVSGPLSNVNGKIALAAAHVGGGIKTVNGDISVTGTSRVEGGILVQKPAAGLMQMIKGIPRIVIGPGATVQGDLHFERTVQLFVSDKATIGPVSGATPVPFTGDSPPN